MMFRFDAVFPVRVTLVLIAVGVPARAEVVESSNAGFHIQITTNVTASPEEVYDCIVDDIDKWWEADHTFSGDAKNLYLEDEPKGWFGERLPEGGCVRHMEVLFAMRGRYLRLRGELGPLQEYALIGTMTWKLVKTEGATQLQLTYYVGGYRPGGLEPFAAPVNQVLMTQVGRLTTFLETGSPD